MNKEKKVTPFGNLDYFNWCIEINFFFALIGFPISVILTYLNGDLWLMTNILKIEDLAFKFNFLIYLALSGFLGIIITISVLMACTLCSPTTFNISGIFLTYKWIIANLKDVALTYAGFIFFDDVSLTLLVAIGLGFSFSGAIMYIKDSYAKEIGKKNEKT